jgi:hypothetical protein
LIIAPFFVVVGPLWVRCFDNMSFQMWPLMNFNDVFARITRRVLYLHFLIANPDSCLFDEINF